MQRDLWLFQICGVEELANSGHDHGQTPEEILAHEFNRAAASGSQPLVSDMGIQQRTAFISRNPQDRTAVRLLMSCLLAKAHSPHVDVRKPYTALGTPDSFSGRTYDERYLTAFIRLHNLPCKYMSAFLAPAWRTHVMTLTPALNLGGRPSKLHEYTLQLLSDVYENRVTAEDLLAETVRCLIIWRDELGLARASGSKLRIFVSHSSKDTAWCAEFVAALGDTSIDTWYDQTGLNIGDEWVGVIEREMESRPVFLVIITPDSWTSDWVQREYHLALNQHKRILGVIHKQTQLKGFITTYQLYDAVGVEATHAARTVLDMLSRADWRQEHMP